MQFKLNISDELKEKFEKILDSNVMIAGTAYTRNANLQSMAEAYTLGQQADKALLEKAFNAGIGYSDNCFCGICDYCTGVKTTDEPRFESWYNSLPLTPKI